MSLERKKTEAALDAAAERRRMKEAAAAKSKAGPAGITFNPNGALSLGAVTMGVMMPQMFGAAVKGLLPDLRVATRGESSQGSFLHSTREAVLGSVGDIRAAFGTKAEQAGWDRRRDAYMENPWESEGGSLGKGRQAHGYAMAEYVSRRRSAREAKSAREEEQDRIASLRTNVGTKEIESVKQQVAMMERLIEKRRELTKHEDAAIAKERSRIASLNEKGDAVTQWFGSKTFDQQQATLQLARKFAKVGASGMSKEEAEELKENPLMAEMFSKQIMRAGRKGGVAELIQLSGMGADMEDAQEREFKAVKEKKAIEEKVNVENNFSINFDPELAAKNLTKYIEPLLDKAMKQMHEQTLVELKRMRAENRKNDPVVGF